MNLLNNAQLNDTNIEITSLQKKLHDKEEEENEEEQSNREGNEEDECLSIDKDNDCKI